jgi:hypothetical protein
MSKTTNSDRRFATDRVTYPVLRTSRDDPEKIPLWVLPCALGFFVLSLVVGWLIAGVLKVEPGGFLLRFSPLFTWAATFVLALYLGRRLPEKRIVSGPSDAEVRGFLWWEGPP